MVNIVNFLNNSSLAKEKTAKIVLTKKRRNSFTCPVSPMILDCSIKKNTR